MRPVLVVLIAAALFGTTGTAQALGAPDVDPLSLGSARLVFGGAALALVATLTSRARAASRPSRPSWGPRSRVITIGVGALAVVAYQPTFFAGVDRNGVAIGTLVALGSAPLATGVLSALQSRRLPSGVWCIATALALAGIVGLSGLGSTTAGPRGVDGVGLAASLGAGVSYAVYTIASKRLLDDGWTPTKTMGTVFGVGAAVSLPILLGTDLTWLRTLPGVATVAWLALATVCIAYLLFARGLRDLAAPAVATLTLAEPLVACILGIALLGEILGLDAWIGLAAIVAGMLVLTFDRRQRAPVAPPSVINTN